MNLLEALKQLKNVQPEKEYSDRSRSLILSAKPEVKKQRFFEIPLNFQTNKWALAMEISTVIVIAIIAGLYQARETKKNELVAQANEINSSIQLKLNEIQYFITTQSTSTAEKANINQSLQKAMENLSAAQEELKNGRTEISLQRIKDTENIFKEVEASITAK